ncbi:MAG TPA: hypothetical protein VM888_04415 [Chitinophagaceae bacterium]|jgi:hypothetical protein|nr:hypothetical protein [Chitinophagaceae bacterium]
MKRLVVVYLLLVLIGCKEKEAAPSDTDYFPAAAYIKSQIAHVDTSVFPIIKIVTRDSVQDTIYIKREQFKNEAKDFLALPDITSKKLKKQYKETKQYDEALQKITFAYHPTEEEEIQQQVVIVKPDPNIDKVETIFIDWMKNIDNASVQKKMTWQANRYFRIITITQKKGQPDKLEKVEVRWIDPSAE